MSEQPKSVWVKDRRTDAVVGYMTPDGQLVRIANAGDLYARYLRIIREGKENAGPV